MREAPWSAAAKLRTGWHVAKLPPSHPLRAAAALDHGRLQSGSFAAALQSALGAGISKTAERASPVRFRDRPLIGTAFRLLCPTFDYAIP
jgi:hypothetical protein